MCINIHKSGCKGQDTRKYQLWNVSIKECKHMRGYKDYNTREYQLWKGYDD